jgi:protein-S-isoprenylcysteine O-methyltransferase Ste14
LWRVCGWSLVGAGGVVNVWAWWASGRVDLGDPHRLVIAGPYAISRNPMYVGWGLLHLGIATVVGSVWTLATFPPAAVVLHWQVLREEQQLRQRFGEDFRRRCATVPRYARLRRGHPEQPERRLD